MFSASGWHLCLTKGNCCCCSRAWPSGLFFLCCCWNRFFLTPAAFLCLIVSLVLHHLPACLCLTPSSAFPLSPLHKDHLPRGWWPAYSSGQMFKGQSQYMCVFSVCVCVRVCVGQLTMRLDKQLTSTGHLEWRDGLVIYAMGCGDER